jgi:hypothetical protein
MRKFSLFISLAVLCLLLAPIVATFAQAAPATPADPGSVITGILTAFTGKKWAVLAGFVLTGVVYVVRTYFLATWAWAQTSRGGAIVAIAIAIIGTLGVELAAGVVSVGTILDALMAAIMSAGGYNLFTKLFLPSKPAAVPPA